MSTARTAHFPRRRVRAPRLLPLAALAVALGCGEATPPRGALVATANADGLVLMNRTFTEVDYIAIAADAAPVIDWIPVAGPGIPPGEQVTVPRDQIYGLGSGGGAVSVFWWGARPAAGGGYEFVPGVGGQLRVEGL